MSSRCSPISAASARRYQVVLSGAAVPFSMTAKMFSHRRLDIGGLPEWRWCGLPGRRNSWKPLFGQKQVLCMCKDFRFRVIHFSFCAQKHGPVPAHACELPDHFHHASVVGLSRWSVPCCTASHVCPCFSPSGLLSSDGPPSAVQWLRSAKCVSTAGRSVKSLSSS